MIIGEHIKTVRAERKLVRIYDRRFGSNRDCRFKVWQILTTSYLYRWIKPEHTVLDLGSGFGQFINHIDCVAKYAMDLNPKCQHQLESNVHFVQQDSSHDWELHPNSIDVVFASNFFEHLPDKASLEKTIGQIHRALRKNGKLIAMGPNIKCLNGCYWDFYDHQIMLTERSLAEALEIQGLGILIMIPKFLPYTLIYAHQCPSPLVRFCLKVPLLWRVFGKQFLVVAIKDTNRRLNLENADRDRVACRID